MRIKLICLILITTLPVTSSAKYSGGTGEPNDPYLIATAEDMNAIGADSNDWDKCFKLIADINLSGYPGDSFNILGYYNDSVDNEPFTGIFDGNDHKIWNFTWSSIDRDGIGLFGYLGNAGQIKDLGMENVDVNATNGMYVGGLVGFNWGTITNCYSSGSVSGGGSVGGLMGYGGDLINCHSSGTVSGLGYLGGLAGYCDGGPITNCYSTSNTSGTGSLVGGLVGKSRGQVVNCYATGTVSGERAVGGLVGHPFLRSVTNSCYSTGRVSGTSDVGGLVGLVIGGEVTDSFWDIETSDCNTSARGEGKTTAEMMMLATFTSAGWDFIEIWDIAENQTYPFLRTHLPGDINKDNETNFIDFAIFAGNWLEGM